MVTASSQINLQPLILTFKHHPGSSQVIRPFNTLRFSYRPIPTLYEIKTCTTYKQHQCLVILFRKIIHSNKRPKCKIIRARARERERRKKLITPVSCFFGYKSTSASFGVNAFHAAGECRRQVKK